jgi:hypothetical protein
MHASKQRPPLQYCEELQRTPQPPQLLGSLLQSTHTPPH